MQAPGEDGINWLHDTTADVWNREEITDRWRKSEMVPIYKQEMLWSLVAIDEKGDGTCNEGT